jgi:hypothetical protein
MTPPAKEQVAFRGAEIFLKHAQVSAVTSGFLLQPVFPVSLSLFSLSLSLSL